MDDLLSPAQVEAVLIAAGVPMPRCRVYKIMNADGFPLTRVGGRLYVRKSRLHAWMVTNGIS